MSEPPSKKIKNSMITMLIDKDLLDGYGQISPVLHYNGLVWRVRVSRYRSLGPCDLRSGWEASLLCDSERKSELWRTKTNIRLHFKVGDKTTELSPISHRFVSWDEGSHKCDLTRRCPFDVSATEVSVEIQMDNDGESFARRPILDLRSPMNDVILVVNGQKFPVNKRVLAAQSSYFKTLLCGDLSNSIQEEIEIKNTDPQEFHELLKMMYGVSTEPTTVDNAILFFTMADMFELQIVKDRMENYLLATDLISIHRKMLLASEYKMKILKEEIYLLYKNRDNLRELSRSKEFAEFPEDLVKDLLFGNACDLLPGAPFLK